MTVTEVGKHGACLGVTSQPRGWKRGAVMATKLLLLLGCPPPPRDGEHPPDTGFQAKVCRNWS